MHDESVYPSATEIHEYLDKCRDAYLTFLGTIKKTVGEGQLNGIRHVYSRGEKQNGLEFKETWKIVKRIEKERKSRHFSVSDVWDIIGVTIIFYYPSDVEKALQHFRNNDTMKTILSIQHDEYNNKRGYYAHHLVVKSMIPSCFGVLCEIQLKTLLHDAWASKTHDLSYKPLGELDRRIRNQMELIGSMLQGVEDLSENLRSLVEEQWTEDSERRAAARRALMFDLLHRAKQSGDDVEDIASKLQNEEQRLAEAHVTDVVIKQIISKIEAISVDRLGDASVLATHLACIRPTPDLRQFAEYYIDRWVRWTNSSRTSDDKFWFDASMFRAYAAYVLGDIRRATQLTEQLLEFFLRKGEHPPITLRSNLAYYLAESPTSSEEDWYKNKQRAEALMAEVNAECAQPLDSALLSTNGYIKIAFGMTEPEIREGLDLCSRSVSGAQPGEQKAVADHFFALHERLAWRRLLKL